MSKVRVNYKSDLPPVAVKFKINGSVVDVPDHDFVIRFFVDGAPGTSFECAHKGDEYINCAKTATDTLTCYINNHKFGCGRLCCEFIDLSADSRYGDKVLKTVTPSCLDVVLVDGIGDDNVELLAAIFNFEPNEIASITAEESEEDGGTNIITITETKGDEFSFGVKNGHTGNGIASIVAEESSISDAYNIVTITETNGEETTFRIKNGADGVVFEGDPATYIADDLETNDSEKILSAKQGYNVGRRISQLEGIEYFGTSESDESDKYINNNGAIYGDTTDHHKVSAPISLKNGQTINVTVDHLKGIVIGIVVNSNTCKSSSNGSVTSVTDQYTYSLTATEDIQVKIGYKTTFEATIDRGNPTQNLKNELDADMARFGGIEIPFDQPKTYTFVNGSLVENTGSLTANCSTAKINIADYKAIFYSGFRSTYNGYFAAIFFDDDDNFVSCGLMTYLSTQETPAVGQVNYNMVNVLEDVPEGATKVILQTNKDGIGANYTHKVICFTEVPYNFLHDLNWRQDYYGVKGDGTTDDSAALQLLIENSRGEVTLRAGTYLVENPLVINTMKLRKFNGNGATIKVSGDITAFELQGSCTDDAGPTAQGEFRVSHAGFIFENVTITSDDGTEGTAIYIGNCLKPSILNCYIYHINNGIVMNSTCRDINIIGNNIYQCNSYGILLDTNASLHQLNVSANHISYCKYCFYINDSRQINNFQLTGNDLEVASGSPAGSDNSCIRIIGDTNTILLGEIEIVGNTIQGHSGSSHAIYIHGGSVVTKNAYGITITGNFISGVMGYDNGEGNAIFLANARNIVISGNNCKGVKTSFVKLGVNATYVTINGNAVMDYDRTFAMITTASDATISGLCVCGNVGRSSNITIGGASQDYVSVVGNNLGGGSVTIGTATHKIEANNI